MKTKEVVNMNWHWERDDDDGRFSLNTINSAALVSIAQSLERMASPYVALFEENKRLLESLEFWRQEDATNTRRIRALRGTITRMKRGVK